MCKILFSPNSSSLSFDGQGVRYNLRAPLSSMEDKCSMSVLEAMDCLWFDKFVSCSVPSSVVIHRTLKTPMPISETLQYSSSNTSELSLPEQEISSTASSISIPSEDDCSNQHDSVENKEVILNLKQPTRLINPMAARSRARKNQRLRSYRGSVMRLQKTMSCKTLAELELEEVKGFIDLGFNFSKENLSPRMMSVVPGLQRIGSWDIDHDEGRNGMIPNGDEFVEEQEEEEERGVMRPYLSEAWIANGPESSMVNITLPRVSAAGDMKKTIRCWARTVASVIRQGSFL